MNSRTQSLLVLAVLCWFGSLRLAWGEGHAPLEVPCPTCEQPQLTCQPVCEQKAINKVCYRVKLVPYCRHKCPCSHCKEGCNSCDDCVYYRKVLTKKSVKVGEESVVHCKVQECVPVSGDNSYDPSVSPAPPVPESNPLPVMPQGKKGLDSAARSRRVLRLKAASAQNSEPN